MGNKTVGPDSKLLWWGYLHVDGSIAAKRYFSHLDVKEAKDSPFVYKLMRPFEVDNREVALEVLNANFQHDQELLAVRRKEQGADHIEFQAKEAKDAI